jgi:hypothetical protein
MKKTLFLKTALAIALVMPLLASAESALTVGPGAATARLDFRVVIPRVLLLQVGDVGAGINLVDFDLGLIQPGAGGAGVARTNGAAIPVRVLGNNGVITLTVSNTGDLTNGVAGETIPWTEITVTSAVTSGGAIPHPSAAFNSGAALPVTAGTKITSSEANWTFNYANTQVVPAGTYGGANTNNGRVIYTATML